MLSLLLYYKHGVWPLILMGLLAGLLLLYQVMIVTTVLRWLVRFVKRAWD